MKNQHSAETLRKRKFLMALPLLVFPFITMAFWALGGGKGSSGEDRSKNVHKGFNTELPQAKFDPEEKQDKFSVYQASARAVKQAEKSHRQVMDEMVLEKGDTEIDDNEQRITEKLALINSEISKPDKAKTSRYESRGERRREIDISQDVKKLEYLMENMQAGAEEDPEMAQLSEILEKILDVQHPERVKEKLRAPEFNVTTPEVFPIHANAVSAEKAAVYQQDRLRNLPASAIQATIHQDQEIVSGSVVKIRLTDTISANRVLIPKNEIVYGIASILGERIKIDVPTIRYSNTILPVSLSVFDLDGLEGLYTPGGISRDVSKRGADDAIQSLRLMTLDPSLSAQVADAGIRAAKGLFTRKVKQVRVKLKTGYQLLLRSSHQRN